jgi:poly-gamma-glutamate synthesis protein (capsule biosynthesis protein)
MINQQPQHKSRRASAPHVILFALMAMTLLAGCADSASLSRLAQSRSLEFDGEISDHIMTVPPEPADQTASPDEGHALVSFAGDCTLSNMQGASDFNYVYDNQGPAYFLSGVYEVFANDDLTIVNLEGPLTNETQQIDKGEPPVFWFRSPPEYVQILTNGSVEACNLANNHTYDYGRAGLEETRATLAEAGIDYYGYDDILIREVNGIKIGFFGFAFDSNTYNIQAIMDKLWSEGAEVIVAYFHDGIEKEYTPSANQLAAAHTAIDYGASAVIMSHPHVIQGTEEYNGRFVAYSLGNFCYGGHNNPDDKDSMIVQLEFTRADGSIDCKPRIIPCSLTSTPGTNDYRPMVLTDEEGQRVLDKITAMSL